MIITTLFWSFLTLQAQEKPIAGRVTDAFNEPIPGVNVIIKGTSQGVTTSFDGDYLIEKVSSKDTLQFSFIGMKTQLIPVKSKNVVNVVLLEDESSLDEVVITAYGGKQKKESVVSSIVAIRPSELKIPSSNLSTSLAGRVAGLVSYQRSGEPGADGAEFFVRGVTSFSYAAGPLILIDGVESSTRELNALQPDDIDTFSIMRDASATAVYGARGGNGVISITTKMGQVGKLKVNVRHEQSWSQTIDQIDLADPITYMKLHNEATLARDPFANRFYSLEKIENTENGTNPYVYPATDWYKKLFNDQVRNTRTNVNLSGGSDKVTYYLAGTFNVDNGNLKVDEQNNFNNNIKVNTFGLRSNVGLKLTKTTDASIRFTGQFRDYNGPLTSGGDTYNMVLRADPVAFAPSFLPEHALYPRNHILFGNDHNENYLNPYAETVKGYKESNNTQMKAQIVVNQDFSFITEGLKAKFMFSTDRTSYFDARRQYNPYFYSVIPGSYDSGDDTFHLWPKNPDEGTEFLDYRPSDKRVNLSNYFELVLSYNRTFNEKHNVNSMLVATRRNFEEPGTNLITSLPRRNMRFAGRFAYGYKDKYFSEVNFGLNGSERFSEDNRWGFFPSIGLGYLISKEKFWENSSLLSKVFPTMKLRATYGLSGTDAIGNAQDRFFYLSNVNLIDSSRGYSWGEFGQTKSAGVSINRYANDQITWETSTKMNIGIETDLFNDFRVILDYYTEERENILQSRVNIPVTMGLENTPTANVGIAKGYGIDASLEYNKNFGNGFWLNLRGNFTYAVSEYKYFEDVDRSETPWLDRTGRSTTQQWGYVAERLFIDQADVDNSPIQSISEYGPGDIKYRDINGDGKISSDDRVAIGNPTRPEIIYGFGFSAGYKGFDISSFFQGLDNESFFINSGHIQPFVRNGGGKNTLLKVIADDHWSESNPDPQAFWPRLTDQAIKNNEVTSTWWMRDGAFLRLKSVELGYNLTEKASNKLGLNSARFYATGVNLLTFSNFKLWDPEMGGNGFRYPIQKVYNIGVKIGF